MMDTPLAFGDDPHFPTAAQARQWSAHTIDWWERLLAAYRNRIRTLYAALTETQPQQFVLLAPVEVVTVTSLVKEWVFVRPAHSHTDEFRLLEHWEDPVLARRSMIRRADHEELVRKTVAREADFTLFESSDLFLRTMGRGISAADHTNVKLHGEDLADADARTALNAPRFKMMVDALSGRVIDEEALSALRPRLEEIRRLDGRARGSGFEAWFGDLLRAHGCDTELGVNHDGEQVDFFVHKPFRALIECRWKTNRLQPRELADLALKLTRRPAVIAGIYVAMSGFTESCRRTALHEGTGRTVLLWDSNDVDRLLSGQIHAWDLFEEHVSDRVRRY